MIVHNTLFPDGSQDKNFLTPLQLQKALELYNNQVPLYKIQKEFNVNYKYMREEIKNSGIKLRGNHKYTFDENFFEIINTEEKAYWLGFLYADGGVYTDGYKIHSITIKLSIKDKEHLIKFRNSLNSNHNIKEQTRLSKFPNGTEKILTSCILRITSIKMFNDLLKCGCIPNKSLILKFPSNKILPCYLLNHFIRGYFDGDGSISISNRNKQFTMLGTQNFLEWVRRILIKKCNLSNTSAAVCKKNKIYYLHYGGNIQINRIKYFLYKNASVWMDRKKNIFDIEIIKQSKKGNLNPSYNKTIYTFKNIKTLETFIGTQFDLRTKYNVNRVSCLIHGNRKKCNGWILSV